MTKLPTTETQSQPLAKHLVVCANPSPDSFDHAITAAYATTARSLGHEVTVRDLYAINFDPLLRASERPGQDDWTAAPDVSVELDHLRAANILVLVYPIWFGLPPAILKGYVDRVMGANYSAQDFRNRVGSTALSGKSLLSFSTSALPVAWLREQDQTEAINQIFDVYLRRGFNMKQSQHVEIGEVVHNLDSLYAGEQLARVRETAQQTCLSLTGKQREVVQSEA